MSAVELLELLDNLKKINNIESSLKNIKNDIEITNNIQKMREFLLLEIEKGE